MDTMTLICIVAFFILLILFFRHSTKTYIDYEAKVQGTTIRVLGTYYKETDLTPKQIIARIDEALKDSRDIRAVMKTLSTLGDFTLTFSVDHPKIKEDLASKPLSATCNVSSNLTIRIEGRLFSSMPPDFALDFFAQKFSEVLDPIFVAHTLALRGCFTITATNPNPRNPHN